MNILLALGILLAVGYTMGWVLHKAGIPRILGYIAAGAILSPYQTGFVDASLLEDLKPIMDICLAVIAFEVGGSLLWDRLRVNQLAIFNITLLASFVPYLLIFLGIFSFSWLFPAWLPLEFPYLLAFALLLGALASPTEPAATLAVMHQYRAKGPVTDTIMGVAALDDALGVLLFSLTLSVSIAIIGGGAEEGTSFLHSLGDLLLSILLGIAAGLVMNLIGELIKIENEGQWIVIILSLLILSAGLSRQLGLDEILVTITMGVVVVNTNKRHVLIFRIIERYTEALIFLFFFVLSGLHLDTGALPGASLLILIFVFMRFIGKYVGAYFGAAAADASPPIRKHTAGGLIPQGGIVVGLALSVYQLPQLEPISEILLTTIMGAMVIHEFIGPLTARRSLIKAGETNQTKG
jgi:Kef-type K+ transport system membrane component KefB